MSEGAAPSNFLDQDLVPNLEYSLISLISEMHFAISILHVFNVLLMPSSAVTQAQPEPEAGCLLQSPGQQLVLKSDQAMPAAQIPSDLQSLCSGSGCTCIASNSLTFAGQNNLDLAGCRSHCERYPALTLGGPNSRCTCCVSTETETQANYAAYKFVRSVLVVGDGRLHGKCDPGQKCRCEETNFFSSENNVAGVDLSDCGYFCYFGGWTTFQYTPSERRNILDSCRCCEGDGIISVSGVSTESYEIRDPPANAVGDPHITTLDGHHYTLMQQGIFSLWHLSGLETQFYSENGLAKTVPVDWQIYTRYAGHQAFTKGLLLVDKTGGGVRQVMEMTSQDCQWRARKADGDWTEVKDDEEISVPDGQDYVTGFRVTKTGAKGYKHIHLNVNTKSGKTDKAVLSLNLQLVMRQRGDYRFVEGELKVSRGVSTLQTDSEFAIHAKWEELGGSESAAAYLNMDQTTDDAFWKSCSREEESKAQEQCSKHLGEIDGGADETFYKDCIYDVCHGAGETAAELAAELLASTRAIEGI
eukprot:s320_g10.t1